MDSTRNQNSSTGASAHNKVKGAAEVVHGLGETIRGNLLSTVDPGNNEHVVRQGEREMREGNADLARGSGTARTGGMTGPPSHRMQYAERRPDAGVPGAGTMDTTHGTTHASTTTTHHQQPSNIPGTTGSTQHAHQHQPRGLPEDRPGDRGFIPGAQGGGF
ncbi:hypothetical protein HDZ31DRAFT_81966 [Schizophyllum fasciatum]